GSMAMDHVGNIAMGYSLSSINMFPSIAITGRLASDPSGTLRQETIVIHGSGSPGSTDWGRLSAMEIDPVDDCTFWYTDECQKTRGRPWNTFIVSFRFPTCGLRWWPAIQEILQ